MGNINTIYSVTAEVKGLEELTKASAEIKKFQALTRNRTTVLLKADTRSLTAAAIQMERFRKAFESIKNKQIKIGVDGAALNALVQRVTQLETRLASLQTKATAAGNAIQRSAYSQGTAGAFRSLNNDLTSVERSMARLQNRVGYFLTYLGAAFTLDLLKSTTQEFIRMDAVLKGMELTATRFGSSGRQLMNVLTKGSDVNMTQQSAGDALSKVFIGGLPSDPASILRQKNVATGAALMLDGDPSKMFNDLTTAILRFSPKILDNLGIIVKARDANSAYAKSLGLTEKQLTSTQKQFAFYNAAMNSSGAAALEAASKLESPVKVLFKLNQQLATLRLAFGKQLTNDMFGGMQGFAGLNEAALDHIANFSVLVLKIGLATAGMKMLFDTTGALVGKMKEFAVASSVLAWGAESSRAATITSGIQQGGKMWRGGAITNGAYLPVGNPALASAAEARGAGMAVAGTTALLAGVALVTAALDNYNDRMAAAARITQDMLTLQMQLGAFLGSVNLAPEIGKFGSSDADLERFKQLADLMASMKFSPAVATQIQGTIDKAEAMRTELTLIVEGLGLSQEATDSYKEAINSATLGGLQGFITALADADTANGKLALSTEQIAAAFRDSFIPSLADASAAVFEAMQQQQQALMNGETGWSRFVNGALVALDLVVHGIEVALNAIGVAVGSIAGFMAAGVQTAYEMIRWTTNQAIGAINMFITSRNRLAQLNGVPLQVATIPYLPASGPLTGADSWGGKAFNFLGGNAAVNNLNGLFSGENLGWGLSSAAGKDQDQRAALIDGQVQTMRGLGNLGVSLPEPVPGTGGSTETEAERKRRIDAAAKYDLEFRTSGAGLLKTYGSERAMQDALRDYGSGIKGNSCVAVVNEMGKVIGFQWANTNALGEPIDDTAAIAKERLKEGWTKVGVGAGTLPLDMLFRPDNNQNGLPDHVEFATGIDANGSRILSIGNQGEQNYGAQHWAYALRSPQALLARALANGGAVLPLTDQEKAQQSFTEKMTGYQMELQMQWEMAKLTGKADYGEIAGTYGRMGQAQLDQLAEGQAKGWDLGDEQALLAEALANLRKEGIAKEQDATQKIVTGYQDKLATIAYVDKLEREYGVRLDKTSKQQAETEALTALLNTKMSDAARSELWNQLQGLGVNPNAVLARISAEQNTQKLYNGRVDYIDYQSGLAMAREKDPNKDQAIAQGAIADKLLYLLAASKGLEQDSTQALQYREEIQRLQIQFEENATTMSEFMTTEGQAWTDKTRATFQPLVDQRLGELSSFDPQNGSLLYEAGDVLYSAGGELSASAGALSAAAAHLASIQAGAQGPPGPPGAPGANGLVGSPTSLADLQALGGWGSSGTAGGGGAGGT